MSFEVRGFGHVELYVGNAKQAARFWRSFGLVPEGYRGLETGVRDQASWYLRNGDFRLIVTSALAADHPIADEVRLRGDTVHDVSLVVADPDQSVALAGRRGATSVNGAMPGIVAFGGTRHSFVATPDSVFTALGFERLDGIEAEAEIGIVELDHVAIAVERGTLEAQMDFYADVLDFEKVTLFEEDHVDTGASALMSKVCEGGGGKIKLPIVEPAEGAKVSQIEEFLRYHSGPGVQHLAIRVEDIVAATEAMRRRGVEFLEVPDSYYEDLADRVPEVAGRVRDLQRHGVLVDRDEDGYLLQVFTKSVLDRPTLFVELIERHGARGFGAGNVAGLFRALEREQERRGNL